MGRRLRTHGGGAEGARDAHRRAGRAPRDRHAGHALLRPRREAPRHSRHRPPRRGGHGRRQDPRRRGGHLQQGEQRRHEAQQGRPGARQGLCRVARGARPDEGLPRGLARSGLRLQPRLAPALGEHGAHRRGQVLVPRRSASRGGAGGLAQGHAPHRYLPQPHRGPPRARPRASAVRPVRDPRDGAALGAAGRCGGRGGAGQAPVLVRAGRHVGALLRLDRDLHRSRPRLPRGPRGRPRPPFGGAQALARGPAGRARPLPRPLAGGALLSRALHAHAHGPGARLGHGAAAPGGSCWGA